MAQQAAIALAGHGNTFGKDIKGSADRYCVAVLQSIDDEAINADRDYCLGSAWEREYEYWLDELEIQSRIARGLRP